MEMKECSKCHRVLPITHFHKNGFNRSGKQKYRHYCKDCANTLETERYHQKKEYINSQKICCQKCGDSRVYVLDYHHKDKNQKDFTIGKIKKGSLQLIQKEIDKCIVLCANCHREFHYLENTQCITIDEYLAD